MTTFQRLASETSVRNIYWGPSSNAGGHPLDLHSSEAPLSHPDTLEGQDGPPATLPQTSALHPIQVTCSRPSRISLSINPIVRDHLFTVFFDAIQPAWPIVTRESLGHYPCTAILEAAILGVAARHNTAIVSWRDLAHIQEVIDGELRNLFDLRDHPEHSIQTLQALLLLCIRVELCAKSHQDLQRLPFRISFACQIAQELNCHLPPPCPSANEGDDTQLRRTLWAACIFVDTHSSAILGQEMNISMSHNQDFSLLRPPGVTGRYPNSAPVLSQYRFFYTTVGLMACLRSVLRLGYSIVPPTGSELHDDVAAILAEIDWHQRYLDANKSQYTVHEWRSLQMIRSNTHLLFILSLRSINPLDKKLQSIASGELHSVMIQACQTLEWSTSDLIESVPGQLLVTLYSTSRALMVIVDVLRDPDCEISLSTSILQRLWGAVENAREFMKFLMMDQTWGQKWTQAHTLKAIFTRLEHTRRDNQHTVEDGGLTVESLSSTMMESLASESRSGPRRSGHEAVEAAAAETVFEDTTFNGDIWNDRGFSMDLTNVILNPEEWERFFEQYDQELYCPKPS